MGLAEVMVELVNIVKKSKLTQKDYAFIEKCKTFEIGAPITRVPIKDVVVAVEAHIYNDKSLLRDDIDEYYYDFFQDFKTGRVSFD